MGSTLTKKPVQVYLRPEQLEALRYQARRRNVTVAALVRQGVDRILAEVPPEQDSLWDIVGMVKAGPSHVSEKHDEYLAQMTCDENH